MYATAIWQPGSFFVTKPFMLFPLQIHLIEGMVIANGSYMPSEEIVRGSILLEINGMPLEDIISTMRGMTYADALNPWFIEAEISERFSMFYASIFGLPDEY